MYCGSKCRERARPKTEKRLEQKRSAYRAHYQRNKDAILAKNREWIKDHPEKPREYTASYRDRNPEVREKERIRIREYHAQNRDIELIKKKEYRQKNSLKMRRYAEENREKLNEYSRNWQAKKRAENPELNRQKQKEWYRRNPAKYLAKTHRRETRLTGAGGSYTAEEWNSLLDKYGHRCLRCGKTGIKLTVDHVIPVLLGGTSNIDNLQPLCLSCNSHKHTRIVDYRPEEIHGA
jgi:5-methylcytosine-specific restriction endonuclease McrA